MTGRYRKAIISIVLGLLAWAPAMAQSGDTVRSGAGVDSAFAATDSALVADSTQLMRDTTLAATDSARAATDTSASSSGDESGGHAEPIVLRTIADSVVADWKNDKVYAYANDPEYWRWRDVDQPAAPESAGPVARLVGSRGFEYFILFVMGGILVYAIVRIIVSNRLQLFYRPPKRAKVVKTGQEEAELDDDLDGRLAHFIQAGDYRQAVRYLYLKTLRELNDRGMIRFHQESTNQEYRLQLSETPQGRPFRDLTAIYEKVWYGEFPLGEALFVRLHQYFEDFYKSVRA